MSTLNELIKEIKGGLTQIASSGKDEVRVMKEMLNDTEYTVGVYSREGKIGEYCPAEDVRTMLSNVVSSVTKISKEESEKLVETYKFKNSDAQVVVNVSKEFINTYMSTGRKLPLGGRERSDVNLALKDVKETVKTYPKRNGCDEEGNPIFQHPKAKVKAHESIRVIASCPEWIK